MARAAARPYPRFATRRSNPPTESPIGSGGRQLEEGVQEMGKRGSEVRSEGSGARRRLVGPVIGMTAGVVLLGTTFAAPGAFAEPDRTGVATHATSTSSADSSSTSSA